MKRLHIVTAMAVVTLGVSLAAQQQQQEATGGGRMEARPTTVARFYNVRPKEGHAAQLEEGMKKHMAWHRSAGDTGSWHIWNVETGPLMGNYLVGTLGRTWKGLEQASMGAKDEADVALNIGPHVDSVSSSVWVYRGDISPGAEGVPSALALVTEYHLRPEGVPVFENTVRQITAAMMKLPEGDRASPPMIYELMAGGDGPRLAIVFRADDWGGFAPRGTMPLQALEKALGPEKAAEIMRTAGEAIKNVESQIIRYRPDLSSPAAGAQ